MPQVLLENQPSFVRHVIADIEWSTESLKSYKDSRKEMSANAIEHVVLTSSVAASKDQINVGRISRGQLPDKGVSVSLGAWLAHEFRTGTVVALEEIEHGREEHDLYWLCVINDGQVVIGTDTLFEDWESAVEYLSGTLEALDAASIGFVGTGARDLQINIDAKDCPSLSEALSKSTAQKAKIRNSASGNLPQTIVLAGVLAILGGGLAWYFLADSFGSSETAAQAEQRRAQQQQRAQFEFEGILNDTGGRAAAGATLKSLWDRPVSITQTRVGGWVLQGILCAEAQCIARYLNTNLSQPTLLRESISRSCETLAISADGTSAQCTIPVQSQPLVMPEDESGLIYENQLQAVLLGDADRDVMLGEFMKIATLGPGTAYAINEPVEYPFRGSRYLPLVDMWNQGEWALTFPMQYWQTVANMLGEFNGVSLSEVSINWGSKVVELQGLYVAKRESAE